MHPHQWEEEGREEEVEEDEDEDVLDDLDAFGGEERGEIQS